MAMVTRCGFAFYRDGACWYTGFYSEFMTKLLLEADGGEDEQEFFYNLTGSDKATFKEAGIRLRKVHHEKK